MIEETHLPKVNSWFHANQGGQYQPYDAHPTHPPGPRRQAHAVDTYGEFADANKERLRTGLPEHLATAFKPGCCTAVGPYKTLAGSCKTFCFKTFLLGLRGSSSTTSRQPTSAPDASAQFSSGTDPNGLIPTVDVWQEDPSTAHCSGVLSER